VGENETPTWRRVAPGTSTLAAVVSSRQTWQVLSILSLLIALAGVGGVIHIGSQSKFIPYVVQVDKLGQTHRRGGPVTRRQGRPCASSTPRLPTFISDARMVTPDVALQRKAVFRLYSMLVSQRSGHGQNERMAERQ
jgi:type IV secretory pathway TrbF-like protein